jgi:probable O-glycosylation ligase (exosortase A-associated)
MRDVFMLLILPVLLWVMAQRAFIGVGMWVWTALFFPNGWVYGLASNIRYNLLFTGVAILSYLVMKNKPRVHLGAVGGLILLFYVWTTISTLTSIGNPEVVWEIWSRFTKIVVLFVFVLLVIEKKLHVDFVLWCVVLSVAFYANLEAIKYIVTGGHHKIAGMGGHVLGDRNELAVAFVMTLPICYYLLGEYGRQSRVVRFGLLVTIALLAIAVIGTQSRGGFIALLALGGYLFLKSERKILTAVLIGVIVAVIAQLASSEWVDRINTMDAVDEDASFLGRVMAWKLSFIMAVRHPFFGGGFKAIEYIPVWSDLTNDFFSYPWFYTGSIIPNPLASKAAHSIYFQVLGDHGFFGLAIYLAFLGGAFWKAGKLAKAARQPGIAPWLARLATMLQLSIFSFALGGAALSFAYFDLIFAIIGLVIVLDSRILPALQAEARTAQAVPRKGLVTA